MANTQVRLIVVKHANMLFIFTIRFSDTIVFPSAVFPSFLNYLLRSSFAYTEVASR